MFLSETRGTDLEDFDDAEFDADADDSENTRDDVKYSDTKEENLNPRSVTLDPIFKAQPLTIQERIRLRQEALKKCDPLLINVGKYWRECFSFYLPMTSGENLLLQLNIITIFQATDLKYLFAQERAI